MRNVLKKVANRSKLVFTLVRVDGVRYRYKAYVVLREKLLRQAPDLDIVAPETAEVFDEHRRCFAEFELGYHVFIARPVHCNAGDTVVEKVNEVCIALFLGNLGQQLLLRRDLSRSVFAKQCAIRIDKQQKERYNNVVIDNDVII